jgi:iron complex outermembrane recepter protein
MRQPIEARTEKGGFFMKRISTFIAAGTSALALTAGFGVTAAFAQTTEAKASEEAPGSDDIIVTARRRDESAQDVPAVVQAVTAETLEKLNLRKFEDIQSVVPGLSLIPNSNGIGAVSTVRGVDFNVNASGNNGTVEFYYNDAPLSSNVLFQSLFDVAQIEVLRGPQGTLKGRSSPSGSISFATRKPNLNEVGLVVNGTANDIGGYNVNGAINVPVIAGKLGVRVAGVNSNDDGNEVRPINGAEKLRNEGQGFRTSVRANPFEDVLILDFSYLGFRRKGVNYDGVQSLNEVVSGAAASPVTIRGKDRTAVDGFARTTDQKFKVYNWNAELNLAGQKLVYTGLHLNQRLNAFAPNDVAGIFANDTAGVNRFGQPTDTLSKSTSHEIRLQNDERIGGIFDYVVGYLNYDTASDTNLLSPTGIALINNPLVGTRLLNVVLTPVRRFGEATENSYFGNLSANFGGFEISGGLRKIRVRDDSGLAVGGVINPLASNNVKVGKTVYSGSISYKVSDDLLVYANTGTSFRPGAVTVGGILGLLQPTAQQRAFFRTAPETSRSYEVGFKADFLDKRLRFNLSAYHQKFTNYPYLAPGTGVFAGNAANNSASQITFLSSVPVTTKGVEVEFQAKPTNKISFGGVLSYAKGQIKNGNVACLDLDRNGQPDSTTGVPSFAAISAATNGALVSSCALNLRANSAPRFSASFQSEYNTSLSNNIDGYLRTLTNFQGKSQNDPVNALDDYKSYTIFNLYLGVRDPDGAWEVSLFGKNLANTFRVLRRSTAVTSLRGGIPLTLDPRLPPFTSAGSSSATNYLGDLRYTDPREFGVSVKFAIGSK